MGAKVGKMRIGFGYDVHPFDSSRQLVLGGVIIDGPGLSGHSDADVVAHAVADSLLGISGHEDLGTLFPATDPKWAGVSSMVFLEEAARLVRRSGFSVNSVDVVINAEIPNLAPHIPSMRDNIRKSLEPALSDGFVVAIKAKRGEGIGFVGREEGIQCWATSLLRH